MDSSHWPFDFPMDRHLQESVVRSRDVLYSKEREGKWEHSMILAAWYFERIIRVFSQYMRTDKTHWTN